MAISAADAFRIALEQQAYNTMCGIGVGGGPPNFSPAHLKALQLNAAQFQQKIAQAQAQAAAMGLQPGGLIPLAVFGGLASAASAPSAPHEKWTKKIEQIVAGEIIGYRAWTTNMSNKLASVAASYVWEPKQVAEGKPLEGYGIHAYKDPYHLMEEQRGCSVFGTIAMWGDVIEHEHGYRSQYARIVSLDHFSGIFSHAVKSLIIKAYL